MSRHLSLVGIIVLIASAAAGQQVRIVQSPPKDLRTPLYVSNQAPLLPSPLVKLPIGAIRPRGWILNQLEIQRDGMSGHLQEISQWCRYEGNAWVQPEAGHSGWEEMPYWLKGYGDLGHVLKDQRILADTRKWVEAILTTQREDGWFGPRNLLTSLDGKPDLWPNMIVLNILQSWHEATADPRVVPFMTRYFKWQLEFPEKDFMAGYWPKMRAGDNIESIYWVYNRTGEKWLLDVAAKCHRTCADWTGGIPNWHGVNFSQGFREPGIYYMQALDEKFIRAAYRNYDQMMGIYGQFPGGGFASDENCREGYIDPRQGFETCSIVEYMHSFEMLMKVNGDPVWADRNEDLAFNTFPASYLPDFKGLRYLTSANVAQADRHNHAPGIQNGGTMLSYSAGARYRCCQHNVAHGWPYYAQEMWLATSDRGLCASLYAASEVTAKVGDGHEVTIAQETDYPFSDVIRFRIGASRPVAFPLYLRVPGWCANPAVLLNGQGLRVEARPHSYIVIDRAWKDGDLVELRLPMSLWKRTWEKNHNSVSINHGPLTFSLKIGEKYEPFNGTANWPDFEVFPTTPWNYGLVLADGDLSKSFEVVRKPGPLARQPFTHDAVPIELRARGRRIPQWKMDSFGLVATLQPSPARTSQPVESITLIPMGAARLRISSFPVATDSPDAKEWIEPPPPPTASHCFEGDTTLALNDNILPRSSNDKRIRRFTWWDRKGSEEWVQYDSPAARRISSVEVYWFDDTTTGGGCKAPQSWQVMVKAGDQWKPVTNASSYGTALDQFNKVTFDPVETSAVRLVVRLKPGFSGGILEWRVNTQ
jgi:hypothetical protein